MTPKPRLEPTPSQTIGPFFHFALPYPGGERLVAPSEPDAVRIVGAVYDGAGEPVQDAMVEIWQANRAGRYAHPEDRRVELPLQEGFTGFGRCPTDAEGRFEFLTVKPGVVPSPDGRPQAPHIDVAIFARGLLRQLVTRIYFPDEEEANAADPVLSSIEDQAVRSTLIAHQLDGALGFDIYLQGDRQTVFFDV
jgi:protocatechuate 3,4-dioxygenase, alpha subunit